MTTLTDAFGTWMRDYVVDGVPASGNNSPAKTEGRAIGGLIDGAIGDAVTAGVTAGGAFFQVIDLSADGATFTAATAVKHWRNPGPLLLTEVRAQLTAPDASNPTIVDVNVGGVSIMSAPVQVDATKVTSIGSSAPMAIVTPNILDDSLFTFDIDTAGAAATGLKVTLKGMFTTYGVSTMPFFVAVGAVVGAGSGLPVTVAYPTSGILAGDTAILMMATAGGIPNRPSGWTSMGAVISQAGFRYALFWRACTGSENGTNVTLSDDGSLGGGSNVAAISVWRGCPAMGAPYEALAENSGHSLVMAGEPVLTTGTNRRAVTLWIAEADTFTDHTDSVPDAGWTQCFDPAVGGFNNQCTVGDAIPVPLPGSVAAPNRTMASIGQWATWSFALVPG